MRENVPMDTDRRLTFTRHPNPTTPHIMKIPSRWTTAAIKKAFAEGTEERIINGRAVRVATDPALQLALTSVPKTKLHAGIQAGPWASNGELEVRLVG
jgi:hypothetical protein